MSRNLLKLLPALLAAGIAWAAAAQAPRPIAGDPYPVYKRVFEKKIDQGKIAVEILRDSGAVDLTDCIHGSTYLESDPGPELSGEARQLADLAYEVVRLGRLLRKIGYPETVWRPLLVDLERKARTGFTPARGGYLEKLSETLNAYRRRAARSLPTTVVEGCGEGA